MTEPTRKRPASAKDRDSHRMAAFIEELAWLMSSYANIDFRALPELISRGLGPGSAAKAAIGSYASSNPNKHFLVGALPRVLTDDALFPTNEDIAQFAQSVMDLRIPRFGKKSKYEIIGHIVCETDGLDDGKLAKLVSALATLTDGDEVTRTLVRKRKEQNFEWNEIIQELAATSRDA